MSRFAALLDACVLVPVSLTDTLLHLAQRELYRPLWSERILQEAEQATVRIHPDADPATLQRRFHKMNAAFDDAAVTGWQHLESKVGLPDPDDNHVLAAAITGRADAIVTANLADFPALVLAQHGLHALSPEDFLLDLLDLSAGDVVRALVEQAAATRNPALTVSAVLGSLARAGVPGFAAEVARHI